MSSSEATLRVPSLKKTLRVPEAAEEVDSPQDVENKVMSLCKAADAFEDEFQFHKMKTKIHRFPPGLRGLGDRYVVPTVVAIGPYHHRLPQLMEMEKVKDATVHHFINAASLDISPAYKYENIYREFFPVAIEARSSYAKSYARDAVAGIEDAEFVGMMFRDACFLLQYMQCMLSSLENLEEKFDVNPSLRRYFFSNRACIDKDVMLLENQLPWKVLDALRKFSSVKIEDFVAQMGNRFQIREDLDNGKVESFDLHPEIYTPPHLLGLLRFYKLGGRKQAPNAAAGDGSAAENNNTITKGPKQVSVSSAIELAEIGVRVEPSKTEDLMDMGMETGAFLGKLFLAPLSLDGTRECWLVNMAAFEVCTASRFKEDVEKTAVCSYIALLAMLMDQKEDAHRLRSQNLVHGIHTSKEMLDFFKSVAKHLPDGGYKFAHIMADIENYKQSRRMWIKVYRFGYKHGKTVAAVLSIIGAILGILKAVPFIKLATLAALGVPSDALLL